MITGKNINLRLVDEKDLDYIYSATNDLSNTGDYWPVMLETKKAFLDKFAQSGFWNNDFGKMLIVDKDDNILGEMNFFKGLWYMPGYEIGYRIYSPKDRGKGFSSEALELFVDFLFKSKQINRLEIETDVNNIGSKRIAEKCGFVVEGIKKQSCFMNGRYSDNVIMGLIKEDYFMRKTM